MKRLTAILGLTTILVFISIQLVFAEENQLIIRGNKTVWTGGLNKLTEGPTAPENPSEGDRWRNTEDNMLYVYKSGAWVVQIKTADIDTAIATFKANLAGVNDPEAKECLKQLGKVVLKLYNKNLP